MKSIDNDLRGLKWILVLLMLAGLFAAIYPFLTPFLWPGERMGFLVFLVFLE